MIPTAQAYRAQEWFRQQRNSIWTRANTAFFASLNFLVVLCALCSSGFALDRNAFTFTAYDLNVRVMPATSGLNATGKITLRNDSSTGQKSLSLQISSSLSWQGVRLGAEPLTYITQPYETDIDHTGAVSEAVVTLPAELEPRASIELEVSYSGTIAADSTRLTRIGTPEDLALRNDWDRISPEFTAVRGVGYVCWYPVAMDAASLSAGNEYFDTLGIWKQRHQASTMKLTIEAIGAKNIAANGRVTGTGAHEPSRPGESSSREAQFSFVPFGLYPPSFAIADFTTLSRPALEISYIPDHRGAAEEFALATEKLVPFITGWFGPPHEKVQVIELADPGAVPFDSGAVVFTPLRTADRAKLEIAVAHQLAHASVPAGILRPWVSEGLAHFAQALTAEQQGGREAALSWMSNFLPALQAAEKQGLSPTGTDQNGATQPGPAPSGQPLVHATDPTYYGIKAMFVWWMLRDIIGDDTLERAIRGYRPADDKEPGYLQRLVQAQTKLDFEWFFDDWVYRDRGLPDFRISTAFPRSLVPGNYSVTVTIENLGNAAAEVPFTVRGEQSESSARMLVKAKSSAVQRVQLASQPVTATVNDGSVPEADKTNNGFQFQAPNSQ